MAGAIPLFGNLSSDAVTRLAIERGDRCKEGRRGMWHLIFLLIGSAMAGESGPESSPEFSDTTIKIEAPLPYEEAFPTPLPGLLYPRESESREVRSLDGLWDFVVSPEGDALKGYTEAWFNDDLSKVRRANIILTVKNEILNERGQESEGTNLKLSTSDKIKKLIAIVMPVAYSIHNHGP